MKKHTKILAVACCCVSVTLMTAFSFYSDLKELLEEYETSNPTYQKIAIQNALNVSSGEKYESNLQNIQTEIENINNNISAEQAQLSAYEADGNVIGALNCRLKIDSLEIQLAEAQKSVADCTFQAELAEYYEKYAYEIIDSEQRNQKYNMVQQCLSVAVYESQIEYCNANIKQLEELFKAEEKKLELGYSTAISVNELDSQLATAKAELTALKGRLELIKETISENSDYNYTSEKLSNCSSLYSEESYVDDFYKKNPTQKRFIHQIKAYDNYIINLSEISGTEAEINNARLQRDALNLDFEQYKIDLPLYVKGKVTEYNIYQEQLKAKEKEISVCEEKIAASELLLEKGKIKPSDLTALETELAKLKFEKTNILYQINLTYYILENQIEL